MDIMDNCGLWEIVENSEEDEMQENFFDEIDGTKDAVPAEESKAARLKRFSSIDQKTVKFQIGEVLPDTPIDQPADFKQ